MIATLFYESNGAGFSLQYTCRESVQKCIFLKYMFQRFAAYFCILHVYEPESHLHRCLEHRDWPICGHKCSIESGSTARRRLDHPETITSSEKHRVAVSTEETRKCRMSFRIFSRIPIQFEKMYFYSQKKLQLQRIQRSTKILLDTKL